MHIIIMYDNYKTFWTSVELWVYKEGFFEISDNMV